MVRVVDQRIRVLLVVLNAAYGGAEKHVYQLFRHLDRSRFQVLVFCPRGSVLAGLITRDSPAELVEAPMGPAAAWPLARNLGSFKPQILHLHGPRGTLIGRIVGAVRGRRSPAGPMGVISTAHGWIPRRLTLRGVFDSLYGLTGGIDHLTVAVSQEVQARLLAQGRPAGRIRLIHNGVELPAPPPPPPKIGGPVTFGYVGRLVRDKGVFDLLAAAGRLAQVGRWQGKARLIFRGDGPDRDSLAGEVAAWGHGSLELAPAVPPALVAAELDKLDVVVLPSLEEGFPYILLEAMARTRPVIATRTGGVPELVAEGRGGFLVPPGDPAALAAALDRFVENPALVREQALLARSRAEDFPLQAMVDRIEATYQQLIGG